MEKARSRYIILGLSDGLFLGLGLSLGISFFHNYNIALTSILLVGITGALSNLFAIYNAETFTTGQQMSEYGTALFIKDYSPRKITHFRHKRSIRYAVISFFFTLLGSLIVVAPYAVLRIIKESGIENASIASLILTLSILAIIGTYHQKTVKDKIKSAARTVGIGITIAMASSLAGLLLSRIVF